MEKNPKKSKFNYKEELAKIKALSALLEDRKQLKEYYTEILKLDKMLLDAGIPHETGRAQDGYQIYFPSSEETLYYGDAIQFTGSIGAAENKLEIMGLLTPEEEKANGVLGHQTAEEVFNRWKTYWTSIQEANMEEDS